MKPMRFKPTHFKPVSTALHLALAAVVLFGSGIAAPRLMLGLLALSALLLGITVARVFLRH